MTTKTVMAALALLMPAVLVAGPAEKVDPVAEGFPIWTGVTDKNYVQGRELCPSDLRHKVTIVIEIEPAEKLVDHFEAMIPLVTRSSSFALGFGANWEDAALPRDFITVISLRGMGKKEVQAYKDLLDNKDKSIKDKTLLSTLSRIAGCTTYCDLSFEGAPDTAGEAPVRLCLRTDGGGADCARTAGDEQEGGKRRDCEGTQGNQRMGSEVASLLWKYCGAEVQHLAGEDDRKGQEGEEGASRARGEGSAGGRQVV